MNEKIRLYYYGTLSRIVFVRFLGELKQNDISKLTDFYLDCTAEKVSPSSAKTLLRCLPYATSFGLATLQGRCFVVLLDALR
jgi:hypothetical protein